MRCNYHVLVNKKPFFFKVPNRLNQKGFLLRPLFVPQKTCFSKIQNRLNHGGFIKQDMVYGKYFFITFFNFKDSKDSNNTFRIPVIIFLLIFLREVFIVIFKILYILQETTISKCSE